MAASDFGDFTEKYNFFKCDVSASDNAVVRRGNQMEPMKLGMRMDEICFLDSCSFFAPL